MALEMDKLGYQPGDEAFRRKDIKGNPLGSDLCRLHNLSCAANTRAT